MTYICHDPRLGPARLPKTFPLLSFVSDYDRFGGQTPGAFLKRWTDKDGRYQYPPQNGFQLDSAGRPILGNMTLLSGTKVDRFGSEYGKGLATKLRGFFIDVLSKAHTYLQQMHLTPSVRYLQVIWSLR